MTCDMWDVSCDTGHETHDKWQVGGGEHSLKMSVPYHSRIGIEGDLKIWRKKDELINDKGVLGQSRYHQVCLKGAHSF